MKRPADNRRLRRLTPEEYRRLGAALVNAKADGEIDQVIDGGWLLALSGCRLGEIVNLKWSEVDAKGGCLRLSDSKEGATVRPAGRAVLDYIGTIKRSENCSTVLSPARSGKVFGALAKGWKRVAKRAGLEDVTPHTLRHSFASVAGDLGYTEPTIAALLGHAAGSVTTRYVHYLDSVLIAAADGVAAEIVRLMTPNMERKAA